MNRFFRAVALVDGVLHRPRFVRARAMQSRVGAPVRGPRRMVGAWQRPAEPEFDRVTKLSEHTQIRTRSGVRAITLELKPGLFLVAEVAEQMVGIAPALVPVIVNAAGAALQLSKKGYEALEQRATAQGMTVAEYLKARGQLVDKGAKLLKRVRSRRKNDEDPEERSEATESVSEDSPKPMAGTWTGFVFTAEDGRRWEMPVGIKGSAEVVLLTSGRVLHGEMAYQPVAELPALPPEIEAPTWASVEDQFLLDDAGRVAGFRIGACRCTERTR